MNLRPPAPRSLRPGLIRLGLRSPSSPRSLETRTRGGAALIRRGPLGGRGSLVRLPRRPPSSFAALLAAALLACSVASPETEVKEALARQGRLELAGGVARIALERVRFSDVAVSVDGGRALVFAVVEADGRVGPDGGPALAYVGREAFAMERCAQARWCAEGGGLPALRGVLAALAEAPRDPDARVVAWQVRVERAGATAGEDYEVRGRRLRARWELGREGDRWRISRGP